jgi:translation initiation factor 2A
VQADWKPEAPERFGDIADLATSLSTIKIEESKKQGSSFYLMLHVSKSGPIIISY